ncbi:Crp/Fnr family transcriptional regulator [Bacillus massiliigorillae]|uniref:Crp/Fnr family transcriptional regulator n=1 Tax=Bacillus massiliigorillae TaxID=1243664 RepID=UPI00039D613B|nr:Crp/Fnr family transcriptional regulator [Bacillus massiliigorillae]
MANKWEAYLEYGHKKCLSSEENLFLQGEKGTGFYYLVEGKINLRLLSKEGKERIIDYVLDGSLLGEQGIFEQAYSTSAVCNANSVLYHFSNDTFKRICQEYPEARSIFLTSLSGKIRMLAKTVTMINTPYEKQMAYFLVQLHKKYNHSSIPITQISLAQYIGTSRITVYKIMKKWSDKSLILIGNQKIDILNLPEMEMLL